MKMFRVYKWDCMIRWGLFGLVVLFAFLSGDSIGLIDYPVSLSGSTLFLYIFVPIHPILWLIALIVSIKNKKVPQIVFSVIAPIVSVVFLFFLFVIHVYKTGL